MAASKTNLTKQSSQRHAFQQERQASRKQNPSMSLKLPQTDRILPHEDNAYITYDDVMPITKSESLLESHL